MGARSGGNHRCLPPPPRNISPIVLLCSPCTFVGLIFSFFLMFELGPFSLCGGPSCFFSCYGGLFVFMGDLFLACPPPYKKFCGRPWPQDQFNSFKISNVLATANIPVQLKEIYLSTYAHYHRTPVLDILIGKVHFELLLVNEYKIDKFGETYAARASIGWSLNGSTAAGRPTRKVESH